MTCSWGEGQECTYLVSGRNKWEAFRDGMPTFKRSEMWFLFEKGKFSIRESKDWARFDKEGKPK